MALTQNITNAAASAACDAVAALLNSGYLRIYDGTQPATADTAITSQVQLAELRFNATAFGGAVNGVATANAIVSDSDADATGTASWYRLFKSDGTTVVEDGSVGIATHNLVLATASIVQHAIIAVSAFTLTQSKT